MQLCYSISRFELNLYLTRKQPRKTFPLEDRECVIRETLQEHMVKKQRLIDAETDVNQSAVSRINKNCPEAAAN